MRPTAPALETMGLFARNMVRPPLSRAITARIQAWGTWKRCDASVMMLSQRCNSWAGPMPDSCSAGLMLDSCSWTGDGVGSGTSDGTLNCGMIGRCTTATRACGAIATVVLCAAIAVATQRLPKNRVLMKPRDDGLATAMDTDLDTSLDTVSPFDTLTTKD